MNEDILKTAIEDVAKKYVKDNVKVSVYKTEPNKYWGEYSLQLDYKTDYKNYSTFYTLRNTYVKHEHYIMRVVSDLCNDLARMTQRERDYFFKRSDK